MGNHEIPDPSHEEESQSSGSGKGKYIWLALLLAAATRPDIVEGFLNGLIHSVDASGHVSLPHLSPPHDPTPVITKKNPSVPNSGGHDSIWVQKGVSGAHVDSSWVHYGQNGIPAQGAIPQENMQDGWGPYYNQRDVRWGNDRLGQGIPSWSEGCYASAYAMLAAHYGVHVNGHLINPDDVIRQRGNFVQGSSPDMYSKIPIPGTQETIVQNPSINQLAQMVKNGDGVIVCLHHSWTPQEPWETDHFIVATGVVVHKDGEVDLIIRDPDSPFGKDVDMASRYQVAEGWHVFAAKDYVSV